MDVSIIIVNYNTRQLLANCLASIFKETKDVSYEVIVVDNASSDGSRDFICLLYPQVIWINSGENLGFGRANNLGVKNAKGEYLFFLNSDTILLNNAIKVFWEYVHMHANDRLGVIGGWLLDCQKNVNSSYGFFPNAKNEIKYLLGRTVIHKDNLTITEKDVDYVIGADMFIKRDLFDQIQGFDDKIFMYYEETDLQLRIARLGLLRRIIPGPQIIHLEGGSFQNKGLTLRRFLMSQRSYNYYLYKHYNGLSYFYNRLVLVLIRLTVFVNTAWSLKDKIMAYAAVFETGKR